MADRLAELGVTQVVMEATSDYWKGIYFLLEAHGQEDSMKRRRHTLEQIVRKLHEADRLLTEGQDVPEVAKQLEVSEATHHRWRTQYGGLKADDVKRLKELEGENARLKRIVADKELQLEALKELGRGNW
jgi:hypothetical protein